MLTAEQRSLLGNWAQRRPAISAMWLFGSQARGDARPDSDHDIALELMPKLPRRGPADDWAFTEYFYAQARWKREISKIVQNKISLIGYREDLDCEFDPRVVNIWSRD